eukprot:m.462074 g.462074  ORF g.462074 m.462074 type:complete len:134 (+) comp22504_c0_seq1:97-498(+)
MADSAENTPGLQTALAVVGEAVSGGPIQLRFTVTNPTQQPQTFCVYHTPMEGIRGKIFDVAASGGEAVGYRGIMVKRAPPGLEHNTTLAPGECTDAEVDIAEAYPLAAGKYTVAFRGTSTLPASGPVEIEVAP